MHRARGVAGLALATLMAFALSGCDLGSAHTQPPSTAPPQPATGAPSAAATGAIPSAERTPAPDESGASGLPSQSDSAFGTIWDAIPAGFPTPPGAEATEPDDGPASAAFLVPTATAGARAIADFYQTAFGLVAMGGVIDGPLEDGSFTTWASSGYGCDVTVRLVPRGGETLATVFYGAGCRFSWSSG